MRLKARKPRKGAAILEIAFVLPVLMLLVWGSIEASGALFKKQTLTSAAHEGALAGMRMDANEADILNRIQVILAARSIEDCTVSVSPTGSAFTELGSGEPFTITITSSNGNQFLDLTSVSVSISSQRP